MQQQLLTLNQTAERLRVRPAFVRELALKQRLSFTSDQRLEASQVEKLALLMDKLRHRGLASLVDIVAEGQDPLASPGTSQHQP